MARGVNGQDIYVDDHDRLAFLAGLEKVRAIASAEILAYCLMGNHFHFAIKVAAVPLSEIMQRLETSYCLQFNHRHNRTGHLFQARYNAKICLTESYLRTVIQYIVMNPVRAGLVSKPEDWPWSSLAGKPLTDAIHQDLENFDPWATEPDTKIDMLRREAFPTRSLEDLAAMIVQQAGVKPADLKSGDRKRFITNAKRLFAQVALKEGHKSTAIAVWLNVANSAITRYTLENNRNQKA